MDHPRRATMPRARVTNFGGDDGIRTHDLCSAIAALSQLSYIPEGANGTRHPEANG
jgi:hypothetical protein